MRGSPNWHNKHITRSEFHSTNASFLSEWAELFTPIATRKQVANVERAENKPETNFSCSASAKRFKPKTIWIHFPNIKVCSKPTKICWNKWFSCSSSPCAQCTVVSDFSFGWLFHRKVILKMSITSFECKRRVFRKPITIIIRLLYNLHIGKFIYAFLKLK